MKARIILFSYAAFLAICGLVAFAMSGFASNARTALIVGCGTAIVIGICGAMAGVMHRNRTVGMIGIHVGLLLPLVFAALFGWRAWKSYADPAKLYLAVILAIMALGSVAAFAMLLGARPKAEMRGPG